MKEKHIRYKYMVHYLPCAMHSMQLIGSSNRYLFNEINRKCQKLEFVDFSTPRCM